MSTIAVADANSKPSKSPIVEAVVDIDCDMPSTMDPAALRSGASPVFLTSYPKSFEVSQDSFSVLLPLDASVEHQSERRFEALRFFSSDERQLVQIRTTGFSFNRLAPYTTLDDYLTEIERTWRHFVRIAAPTQVRGVRLRYINRILIPSNDGPIDFREYITTGPVLPTATNLTFAGFLHQQNALERTTNHTANIVLTSQPDGGGFCPLILDIQVAHEGLMQVDDWDQIRKTIETLRSLKNRIFRGTLTAKCLRLFQ